jgi:hypothetical protein
MLMFTFLYFKNFRYEASAMNCARAMLTACVVKGLPNARDYAYKNRQMLMKEERQKEMADPEEDLKDKAVTHDVEHFQIESDRHVNNLDVGDILFFP